MAASVSCLAGVEEATLSLQGRNTRNHSFILSYRGLELVWGESQTLWILNPVQPLHCFRKTYKSQHMLLATQLAKSPFD